MTILFLDKKISFAVQFAFWLILISSPSPQLVLSGNLVTMVLNGLMSNGGWSRF